MATAQDWEKPIRRMELLLRLKSFPVGFKMLENKEDLSEILFMRRPEKKMTMCQMITLVRNFDWTVGADLLCPTYPRKRNHKPIRIPRGGRKKPTRKP